MSRTRREYFRDQLKRLDMQLEQRLTDNVGMLSGGQRQALTLLMMSLSKPELVLLDEHTAALDPRNASKVLDLTDRFIEDYGFTVMMITHNMQQAARVSQRTAMFHLGNLVEEGATDKMFTNPDTKLTQDYITGRFG